MKNTLPVLIALLLTAAVLHAESSPAETTAGLVRGGLNPAKRGLTLPPQARVLTVPVKDSESTQYGMMDDWQAGFLERRLNEAQAGKYDLVILEIDTNGGGVAETERMNKAIARCPVPVIAFVQGKAFSAGALLSLGCRAIVMAPGSQIGGAKFVNLFGKLDDDQRQKADSMARAMVTGLCEKNNYPVPIAVGMVDGSVELYETNLPGERFVTGDRLAILQKKDGAGPQIVKKWKSKDQLLSLSAQEAVNAGVASGTAASLDEIATGLNISQVQIEDGGVTAGERIARAVSHPIWRVLLVLAGLVAFFWEVKTPGHGLGYVTFAFCMGIFFWLQIFSNSAGFLEVFLFLGGAVLLALEIFVFAAFGFSGIIGFALVLFSIVLSFLPASVSLSILWKPDHGGATAEEAARLTAGLLWAAVTLVSIAGVIAVALYKGAHLPGLSRLALNAEVPAPGAAAAEQTAKTASELAALTGREGVTETVFRPSGKVRVDGRTYDALSEGVFLEPGVKVVVLRQSGSTLVVRSVSIEQV